MKIGLFCCFLVVSISQAYSQIDVSTGANFIPTVPVTVNLLTSNSTEYRGQYSITLKAGFTVTQSTNANTAKYFWGYIEYTPLDVVYAIPDKELDAAYSATINGNLYFVYDEKYNTGVLNYKVYDYMHVPINTSGVVLNRTVVGKNYYQINMNTIPGLIISTEAQKYFTLEIINDKNEKMVLRFKHP